MLALPRHLTLRDAQATLDQLSVAYAGEEATPMLAIDASALTRFDSSALAVLLACRRLAHADAKGFELRGAPAPLLELAGLYGVAELLA